MKSKWIWLSNDVYPNNQTTRYDSIEDASTDTYVVAEFQKTYNFEKTVVTVEANFSADTELQLFCNGSILEM